MTTWRKELTAIMEDTGESFDSLVSITLTEIELDEEFDGGYGCTEGKPFTAWSDDYVYFPICYDGAEWAGAAPRNPCDIKLGHQGGG